MAKKNSDFEDYALQTSSAKVSVKDTYLNLMLNLFTQAGNIVSSPETSVQDITKRISILCVLMINMIPNPKERIRLMAERDVRQEILWKENRKQNMDAEEYNSRVLEISLRMLGEVMCVCDDALGICERQYVMAVADEDRFQENMKLLEPRIKERAEKEAIEKLKKEHEIKKEIKEDITGV